ncbi:hypothetical protein [uncultured Desulfovibrio sp.]|uniref:hypothetical protein n=1 Tax=uncultured Desulfovibrio sp. TaxID=167968 RepID=UPI0025F94AEB|nr:hypothetical protein [uncultured Desulfovibrio sp.]
MAARPQRARRDDKLLARLERRLDLLADTLDAAPIADKSMDVVREIREVHALLRSLNEASAQEQGRGRLVVVWADAPSRPDTAAGPERGSAGTIPPGAERAGTCR